MVEKLKAQEIKLYSIDAPALVNTIAGGEIVASPAIFQTHTLLAASKGAPVEWVPMDLVPTNVGSAADRGESASSARRAAHGGFSLKPRQASRCWKNIIMAAARRTTDLKNGDPSAD